MLQFPAAINEAVLPVTVQIAGVADEKLTARPEVAVAERFNVVPAVCAPIAGKLMVCCDGAFTMKLWLTFGAAPYWLLPACEA